MRQLSGHSRCLDERWPRWARTRWRGTGKRRVRNTQRQKQREQTSRHRRGLPAGGTESVVQIPRKLQHKKLRGLIWKNGVSWITNGSWGIVGRWRGGVSGLAGIKTGRGAAEQLGREDLEEEPGAQNSSWEKVTDSVRWTKTVKMRGLTDGCDWVCKTQK